MVTLLISTVSNAVLFVACSEVRIVENGLIVPAELFRENSTR